MSLPCGCCEGLQRVTPILLANRPGLSTLAYRVGTHATFFETMLARLGTLYWKIPPQEVQSWLLRQEDLQDAAGLAVKLKDARDPVSQFLFRAFSPAALQLLEAYSGCGAPSHGLAQALLDELNCLLQGPSLYDPPRFAGVVLTNEIQQLVQQNPHGEDLLRLNRLLLEAAYPRELAKAERFYPLRVLTTRSTDDPAIALLDAWATVADILTFYEERIANEGYLATATERRSILELARLVGYALRPGVAASVFLAFALEKDHNVEIPTGTRAQSLPGPGELPQSFETSDKLEARARWTTLQPRLTQPQFITQTKVTPTNARDLSLDLYFQGVATQLKPGDPLLFVFGSASNQQVFRRIAGIEPQAAENRTRVTLQIRVSESTLGIVAGAFDQTAKAILNITAHYLSLDEFGVSPTSGIARRVTSFLKRWAEKIQELKAQAQPDKLSELLQQVARLLSEQMLPIVSEEHDIAVKGRYVHLERWLGKLQTELEQVSDRLATFRQSSESGGASIPVAPRAVSLGSLLGPLQIPPSIPPASPQRLDRSVGQVFGLEEAAGELAGKRVPHLPDVGTQLLVTLSPALQVTLDAALANAKVTPDPPLRSTDALRVKAAPFGHNAPLKPILDDKGIVKGYQEWPLAGTVTIRLDFSMEKPERATIVIEQDGKVQTSTISPINPQGINTFSNGWTLKVDQQSYTFQDPTGSAKKIVIATEFTTDELKVAINGGQQIVGLHQTLQYSIEGQDVTISNQPRALFIVNQAPMPMLEGQRKILALDAQYDQITPGSWVAIEFFDRTKPRGSELSQKVLQVVSVRTVSKVAYGLTGTVTELTLNDIWLDETWLGNHHQTLSALRDVTVYAQSEPLALAEEPIDDDVAGDTIELDGLYPALKSGRWLIVSGERSDIEGTSGVRASELAMLGKSTQGVRQVTGNGGKMIDLPGDKTHTTLELASNGLAYTYVRGTVTIYGNVLKATHGETRSEVLGSGDGSKMLQQFALRQSPLTYLAAATPAGAQSTLQVCANDILWHDADTLAGLLPTDRRYITRTDDADKTKVIFGNGRYGARLPTGVENVKAMYRTGIGKPGNVKAEQISLLATKPLGVKGVVNPLPATGGADRDTRDQARRNTPLAVMALDRLVSVQDYADFSRTFAGIGKASAARLSDGRQQLVHVTIAGSEDIPIAVTSDLYRYLCQALHDLGDPGEPIQLDLREVFLLVISAKVRVLADYQWESVEAKIRRALLETFSFDRRELGQDVLWSEVISAIQEVPGVAYVDLLVLYPLPESVATKPNELEKKLKELAAAPTPQPRIRVQLARFENGRIRPAQIAYLTPAVPDTLILTELTP